MTAEMIYGKQVLPALAKVYPQLYLVPGQPGSDEAYRDIVLRGQNAPSEDLSHFRMHDQDALETVETPVGMVKVLTLCERADFERFVQIMANKCRSVEVPATQGAVILDGLNNWQKIRAHKAEWILAQNQEGILFPDWNEEFRRFTRDRENYKDVLIVLSVGPYSNIPAAVLQLEEKEWLDRSYTIRKYHECTHFVCRRKYAGQTDAVWDEVVADAVGILAAFGRFDAHMEEVFFGISENGYTGGRLENYVKNREELPLLALKIREVLAKIAALVETESPIRPFDLADLLEKKQENWW